MAVHEKRKSSILLKGSNRPAYSLIDLTLLILYFFAACAFPAKAAHVGTSKLSNLEFRALTTDNGLSDQLVNTIFKDSEGYLWLGTGVGVDRFDGNNMVNYNFADADGTVDDHPALAAPTKPHRRAPVDNTDGDRRPGSQHHRPWRQAISR